MDPSVLLAGITWQLVVVCLLAFALGAAGGLMHGGDRKPPDKRNRSGGESPQMPDGESPPAPNGESRPANWWRRALIGGVAAVAVLYLTNPTTGVALIGGSIAAGYAGQAVLAGLEARTIAALARQDAAKARSESANKGAALRELLAAHQTLTSAPPQQVTTAEIARRQQAEATVGRIAARYP